MRILFFGTPEIAVPFLEYLIKTASLAAVITQPDRPSERGQKLRQPPVKTAALAAGIPVLQPEKFTPDTVSRLRELKPDAGVAVSYGELIPEEVFNLPAYGSFNVHFSLLPKYRGASPVQSALIAGEKETGVTTFRLERTLDTGPVFIQKKMPVTDGDDAETLFARLIPLGLEAVGETLAMLEAGKGQGVPQSGEPSYARSIKKEDGIIHWEKPAREIFNLIRGLRKWPGAFTFPETGSSAGKSLRILKSSMLDEQGGGGPAGTVSALIKNKGFAVKCGQGVLLVEEVHPENKKTMPAWDFIQGSRIRTGDRFR